MDPVSHLLVGRTVALTVPRRLELTGLTSALVIGSIAPDVDAPLAFVRFDIYLHAHASGTHSLVGAIVVSALLAGALTMIVRGSTFATLLPAAFVGAIGHIVCDLADGSDIGLFQPLSDRVFGWHLFSMADPVVPVVLGVTALLAWRFAQRGRRLAVLALVGLIGVAGVRLQSQRLAIARYRDAVAAGRHNTIEIDPRLSVLDWIIYDRTSDLVRGWDVNAWRGSPTLAFERRDAADTSLADVSRELPIVRTFLGLSKIPLARLETDGSQRNVLWSDARWCSSDRCDVSFGGVFDAGGVLLYQIVRIGGFTQTASAER